MRILRTLPVIALQLYDVADLLFNPGRPFFEPRTPAERAEREAQLTRHREVFDAA
jgi:hypothetical protein